jgi:hypothetical protein
VLLLLLPAPEPGRPRRNRTPCLSTRLFKVQFRRPMPGTRAFVRYALACRVMANTNVDYLAGVRSFVFAISRQAKAYRTTLGRGVRQPRASSNSTTQTVGRSAEMSHAPIITWQEQEQEAAADNNFGSPPFCCCPSSCSLLLPTAPELVPEEGLKPSTSGL